MQETRTTKPYRVLVALKDTNQRDAVVDLVKRLCYPVYTAANGEEALEVLRTEKDVFLAFIGAELLDITGNDVLGIIAEEAIQAAAVLVCKSPDVRTAVAAVKAGAFDVLTPPIHLLAIRDILERAMQKRVEEIRNQEIIRLVERRKLNAAYHTEFMLSIAKIIDAKSPYTNQHSVRVGEISRALAHSLGIRGADLDRIELGGKLHDIGKIGIPEAILNKEGPLTPDEYDIIKTHPTIGAELVRPVTLMSPYIPMILWHHENLDGTGYPDSLKGSEIPLEAQIVKVADTYDALTSARPYRSAMSSAKVLEMLRPCADTTILGELLECLEQYIAVQEGALAEGERVPTA